ncbi:hypothetical protein [Nonomuraea sp. KM88]|uniref:hypothetical protein n=1 Tax=Nonomuraea sp. KM88 TaxID=3457427 RepID=UPI003FCE6173
MSTTVERSGGSALSEEDVIPGLETSVCEEFLSPANVGRALRRVEANRGAPGVDGMTTRELRPWIREHWAGVREALDAGTYRPLPVRRAVIPRPGGGERALGVPSVLDRLIQQAIAQVLAPIFDPYFSPAVVTPASRWHSTASGSFTDTDYHVPSPPKAGQSQ